MAPKNGGSGGSSGGHSSGGDEDEDYDYGTGTGTGTSSGSGDDDDYGTGSGSSSGSGSSDNDYNYGSGDNDDDYGTGSGSSSGSGSGSGSSDSDYGYGTGSGSGDNDYDYDNDFDYDYPTGGSKNTNYNSLLTTSYRWKDAATNAAFAFNIIALLALVLCMFLTMRFKWIREKGTDKLRNSGYLFAAFCMFSYFLIVVIRTAMAESGFHFTKNFVIALIFERLFSLVGDIMIVAIITRTILEDMSSGSGMLAMLSNCLIGLMWLLALVSFSFYAAVYGQTISNGYATQVTSDGSKYTSVFFAAYIFGFSMYLSILSCVAVVKKRSTGSFLMIFIVIPALFLRFMFRLVNESIMNFQPLSDATAPVGLADQFMYTFTTISIFFVVAIIGGLRQRQSSGGVSQEQKLGGISGHNYVPLGPYGPTPAPYGAQAPVGQYPPSVQQQAGSEQYAASVHSSTHVQQVPVSYAAQGQYVAPVQPTVTVPYDGQQQPVQYAPAPGQYAPPVQHVQQGVTTVTTSPVTVRSVSPVHAPVPVSAGLGYAAHPSVSPSPLHDPYQLHMPPHH